METGPTEKTTGKSYCFSDGTVYGNVTLQEDLKIDEGDQGDPDHPGRGLSHQQWKPDQQRHDQCGNGGQLECTPTGTVVYAYTITTGSLIKGTVGQTYTSTLAADGNPTNWSVSSGKLPDGLTLSYGGIMFSTPNAVGTSTFTVTASNSAGNASKEYTLNIKTATISVTGVTLDTETLEPFTGESKILNATVQPEEATNKAVTWGSSNTEVATADSIGNVKAVGVGTTTIL